jgi:flagellar hook protein FlgE
MALSNTLFAGLSGLNVNQTKLNVVANNIANVNTVAFKSSRVEFKPQFYVTDAGGTQPQDPFGGTNPSQRGLGAEVAAIEKNFQPGSIEATGRPTDLAIDGDGFFVVKGDEQRYTRDGTFKINSLNQLVTNGGDIVQGFGVDKDYKVVSGNLTSIVIPLGAATTASATGNVKFEGNLNAGGDVAAGASILTSQLLTTVGGGAPPAAGTLLTNIAATTDNATPLFTSGDVFTLAGKKGGRDLPEASFTVGATSTLNDLMTFFQQGMGININVPDDLNPLTPTAGIAVEVDGVDPNSARIVMTGNLGTENSLAMPNGSFETSSGVSPFDFADGANAAGIQSDPTGESIHTSFVAYDSLGTPLTIGVTAVLESTSSLGNTWRFFAESPDDTDIDLVTGTGTLTFDSAGKLRDATGTTITLNRNNTGADSPLNIDLDFSRLTELTSSNSELVMTNQDGSPIGRLNGFSIGADGKISGSFSNGITRTLGQVAVATFSNTQGLIDRGGNMYIEGPNSGAAVIGTAGTLGTGKVVAGSLELSNVDLSEEFINLIIASTGFSAASRVITTADQLLTELLNTSR